jgi:hypothetical protein
MARQEERLRKAGAGMNREQEITIVHETKYGFLFSDPGANREEEAYSFQARKEQKPAA